jgi:predicted  nucleic acid-binding Zn-ribbon protein
MTSGIRTIRYLEAGEQMSDARRFPLKRIAGDSHAAQLQGAMDDVKRLLEETEAKALELDQALEALRELTEQTPQVAPEERRRPRAIRVAPAASNEAVLRATQMAVAGSERDEIEAEMRDEFGVGDPARLVDQVLGVSQAGAGSEAPQANAQEA